MDVETKTEPIDPTLEYFVAFDDDGSFVDLVRSDLDGIYFRADRGWQSYQPTSRLLEGKTIIDVSEAAVTLFDKKGAITVEQAKSKELAPNE